jgi:Transcriptional regulators
MNSPDLRISKQRVTLRHLVEEKLRELIATGHFRPGDRLVERELCEVLDVSRTSVREALRQLEAEGLIRTEPHRGPMVSRVTPEEAEQLFRVRALLEGFCGAEFAQKGTDEEHARFARAVAAFAEAAKASAGTRALVACKAELYRCMIEGARNTFVESMLTSLHNRVNLLRATTMMQPDRLPRSVEEIEEINAAIQARDVERARSACVNHVEQSAKVALQVLQNNRDLSQAS